MGAVTPSFDDLVRQAEALLAACRSRGLRLAVAESCTGGLLAAALTEVPGASDVLERGYVTYSDRAKTDLLGVAAAILDAHGAVSEAVARAMADGALARSPADLALAVTGIAGPGGGSAAKPVGLVHLAAALRHGPARHCEARFGALGRRSVRYAAAAAAMSLTADLLAATADPHAAGSRR